MKMTQKYFSHLLLFCFAYIIQGVAITASVQAQTKTCKFNFTNNTGETLRRTGEQPMYEADEYTVISELPFVWNPGETHTFTFKANLSSYADLFLTTKGIPVITYDFDDLEANPYILNVAVLPSIDYNGVINVGESHCMIEDYGRGYDVDETDFCKGTNKNGSPLFCVEADNAAGLDVSISYGKFFLHYDEAYENSSSSSSGSSNKTSVPSPTALNQIQMMPAGDLSSAITSSDLPFSFDVFVQPLDYDPGAGQIPALRYWQYDLGNKFIYMGTTGTYLNYCLGAKQIKGSQEVRTDKCTTLGANRWKFDVSGQIKNYDDQSLCLTQGADTKLYLKTCKDGNVDQNWVTMGGLLPKAIQLTKNQTKCMDLYNSNTANGTNIQLWDCKNNEAQTFTFDGLEIKLEKNNKKCLDLADANTNNGRNIQLWDCSGKFNQQWLYDGLTTNIRTALNWDKCLDLVNARTTNGNNIQIWDCKDIAAQRWTISGAKLADISGENTRIHFAKDESKCVDIQAAGTANGTNIQIYHCHTSNASQFWIFDGLQIKMKGAPNKCLDLNQSNTNNGNNIQLYDCNGTNAQKWIYDGINKSFHSGIDAHKCIDLAGGNTANHTNIQIWDCQPGNTNQQFIIEE